MVSRGKPSFLNYLSLEARQLLAGDVTVFENGQLYIRGDELSNQFAIVADESGQITVTGLNDTTINGSSDPFLVNDSTDLNGLYGRNASFEGGVRIQTFEGHDRIDIRGVEFGDRSLVSTGEGDDFVRFLKSSSQQDFDALTGEGDDTLNFVQTRVRGDFSLATSAGHDSIRVFNSRTWGETDVFSGTGDDTVTLDRVRLTGERTQVITHDGDDSVVIRNNDVNEAGLGVYAGEGRDHVFAEMNLWNDVEGEIVLAGQGGFDVLDVEGDQGMADALTHNSFVSGSEVEALWWTFDRGDSVAVEDFNYRANAVEFAETTQINSIDWLGSYYGSEAPDSDNFVVEIFANEVLQAPGGYFYRQPAGEAVARFNIGDDANRVDTGEVFNDAPSFTEQDEQGVDRKIFSYSADIDFEFLAGETYWVSIYAVRNAPTDGRPFANDLNEFDFGVLLDFSNEERELFASTPTDPDDLAEFGELFSAIPPDTTQENPFHNNNAVLYGEASDLGVDPSVWFFSTTNTQTIFGLNP